MTTCFGLLVIMWCSTPQSAMTPEAIAEICARAWRPVTWSRKDTPETIREAKKNNAAWKAFCKNG